MQIRRMTRLTDGHSKKWENHEAALALFLRLLQFLPRSFNAQATPANAAGLTEETWSLERLLTEANRV